MNEIKYGFKKESGFNFEETVELVRIALKKEGFGVLTEINVRDTLKNKLNIEYENYIILGACNPSLAYRALKSEKEIGLILPCNVIVYVDDGRNFVSTINPVEAMSIVNNPELKKIAEQVSEKLKKVIDLIK